MDHATKPIKREDFKVDTAAKVPATRHKVRRLAAAFIAPDTVDNVEWMLAEGLANALIHGRGAATVTVTVDEKTLRVEVQDHGPGLLVARRTDHGRGLTIIEKLAANWSLTTDDTGTCLWFEVDRVVL